MQNKRTRSFRKFRPFRWKKKNSFLNVYEFDEDWAPERGSRIDARARVLFPCAFALFNVLYWTLYLYTIDDEIPDDVTF